MKFSTRTTYGLRAMIKLAKNWGKGSMALPSIANSEKISLGYLERIFSKLKKVKLIKARKGMSGGYKLVSSPKKINIFEIIKALEGKMSLFYCLDENGKVYCNTKCNCGATKVLVEVQKAINNTLKSIKLKDLI